MTSKSSKKALLDFLRANVGKVFNSRELQQAANGAVEFGRRLRELRAEGWDIQTHRDSLDLSPGQWRLNSKTKGKAVAFTAGISKELRARVLERNGFTCQMCGVAAGDIHEYDNRPVRMQIGHIIDRSKGGQDELHNLRALCSVCNEGLQNIKPSPPSRRDLMVAIRRAGLSDQRAVYRWLKEKLGD